MGHYFMLFIIFSHRGYCHCGPHISTISSRILRRWINIFFHHRLLILEFLFFMLFVSVHHYLIFLVNHLYCFTCYSLASTPATIHIG